MRTAMLWFHWLEMLGAMSRKPSWSHSFSSQTLRSFRTQTNSSFDILGVIHVVQELHAISYSLHVVGGLVGLSVLCLVSLPVMDFIRWVFLSMTPLLQMMMLQPVPHPQHPKQVGTFNNPFPDSFLFTTKDIKSTPITLWVKWQFWETPYQYVWMAPCQLVSIIVGLSVNLRILK